MKMKIKIKHFVQISFFLLIILLGAVIVQAQVPEDTRPRYRVVNAALEMSDTDIYVNTTLFFKNLLYSQITDYVPIDTGALSLYVLPGGVSPDVSAPLLTGAGWNFDSNVDYTVIIANKELRLLNDNNKEAMRPGWARVRIVHAASNAPAVEACLNKLCDTLVYPKYSSTYIPVEGGIHDLSIRLVGTNEFYFDTIRIEIKAGGVYSVFMLDPKQGEIKPRIIVHEDTGRVTPGSQPGGGSLAPIYPPVTGAFLSPTALVVIATLVILTGGIGWFIRRQFFIRP